MSLFGRHHWTRTAGTHAADDVGEVFVPLAPLPPLASADEIQEAMRQVIDTGLTLDEAARNIQAALREADGAHEGGER